MARLTPEQLQAAKREKQDQRRNEEEQRIAAAEQYKSQLESLAEARRDLSRLEGVVENLYTEMDKLSKKAPADQITELAMGRVNDVITRGKRLMAGDEFIDMIESFIAAGEWPEHRDVVLVLSELRQGIRQAKHEREQQESQLKKGCGENRTRY